MSVIGLYPIDSTIATIMVQLGNKLPGIGKQHTDESGKSISFSDVQQHGEKHGVGCWWHLSLRTLVRHEGRRGVILAGGCHFNRQAFLVCRGSFIGAKSSGYCSRGSGHGSVQCLWQLEDGGWKLSSLICQTCMMEHTPHLPAALLQDYMHLGAHPPPLNVCCDMELLASHCDWLKWWAVISWASV